MKKILIIISIIFVSLFCINKLDASTYKPTNASLHFYNGQNISDWVRFTDCFSNSVCSLNFDNVSVGSIFYETKLNINLEKGRTYDLIFILNRFQSFNSEDAGMRPFLEEITNFYVYTNGWSSLDDTGTELINFMYLNTTHDSVRVKVTFKVNSSISNFAIGVSFNNTVSGSTSGYSINQSFSIDINPEYSTNDKLDNIDNTMKDDDVDTNGANSFFDDFNDTDHGGLSSIITSPLSAFSKITQTCEPITINVLEKEVILPCGDTLFWNKTSVQAFRTIWNILIGGPLLYALLLKLYHIIEGLKNPDDDRIEVAKL